LIKAIAKKAALSTGNCIDTACGLGLREHAGVASMLKARESEIGPVAAA